MPIVEQSYKIILLCIKMFRLIAYMETQFLDAQDRGMHSSLSVSIQFYTSSLTSQYAIQSTYKYTVILLSQSKFG